MSEKFPYSYIPTRAFVIFSDGARLPFLRFLKRGFRHCFVLIPLQDQWLSLDPLMGRIDLMTHQAPVDHRFIDLFKNAGFSVVYTQINRDSIYSIPTGTISCVSFLKRLLGVRGWFIQTPYALYQSLISRADISCIDDPFHDLFSIPAHKE